MARNADEMQETNPYVFLVGCPRSGTTLLRRILDAHWQLAITRESHWIPRYYEERVGTASDGRVAEALVTELLANPRFTRLGIDREQLETLLASRSADSYASFVSAIFDLYGEACGKSLVGDKTPGYVRRILTLHSLWPSARFVHLVRDGRDICSSVLDSGRGYGASSFRAAWREDPVTTTALWWEWTVRLGREAGGSLGTRLYTEVRYESLVADPDRECRSLCDFLDLDYDDAMLRFHERRTTFDPCLPAKKGQLPVTRGLRDWTSQLTGENVARFEVAAGALLNELGYPRAVPQPARAATRHAARIRRLFDERLRERKRSYASGGRLDSA